MGRKKFIDKKRSATFQLFARDTSDLPSAADPSVDPLSDRVFVRVDNNPYDVPFADDNDAASSNPNVASMFADAPGDSGDGCEPPWMRGAGGGGGRGSKSGRPPLPDHIRKEILELGLPDDGYNYLLHLREIKQTGGGSAYYHNERARMDLVPLDVKAYDASRVQIGFGAEVDGGVLNEKSLMYTVASKTVGVRVQRAVDPDVVKLLDDGQLLMFGSSVEDLEEDFVIKANQPEVVEDEQEHVIKRKMGVAGWLDAVETEVGTEGYEPIGEQVDEIGSHEKEGGGDLGGQQQRVRRLLDAQFDLLKLREYDSESDSDDAGYEEHQAESLAAKLNDALKDYSVDDLEIEDTYKVPGDYIHNDQGSAENTLANSSAEIIRKCAEYAEMYSLEDDKEVMIFEESSDESEVWDCETIVTTYSNFDNHPGKIAVPEKPRKKIPELLNGSINGNSNVITLKGKEKLPVDFLPNNKKSAEKAIKLPSVAEHPKKRPQDESKEAKKERKAAMKEERREARRTKKELKELYRCEAQRAQKVAAFTGPSSMHIM